MQKGTAEKKQRRGEAGEGEQQGSDQAHQDEDEKQPGITARETVRAKKGEEADVKTDMENESETEEEQQPTWDTQGAVVEK